MQRHRLVTLPQLHMALVISLTCVTLVEAVLTILSFTGNACQCLASGALRMWFSISSLLT